MLQQFSWEHFLIAMVVLNLVWYAFVALVFYRAEVSAFLGLGAGIVRLDLNGGKAEVQPGGEVWNRDNERASEQGDGSLMGASRLVEGVELRSSGQVGFAGLGDDGSNGRYGQVGLVADVLQELKLLFSELERKAGDKREFFRLLEVVKENYGPLSGHPSVAALTGFVTSHAPFHLSPEEIENLWY